MNTRPIGSDQLRLLQTLHGKATGTQKRQLRPQASLKRVGLEYDLNYVILALAGVHKLVSTHPEREGIKLCQNTWLGLAKKTRRHLHGSTVDPASENSQFQRMSQHHTYATVEPLNQKRSDPG